MGDPVFSLLLMNRMVVMFAYTVFIKYGILLSFNGILQKVILTLPN